MKKLFVKVPVFCMLAALLTVAIAEEVWICPVCGAENTGNFCENDAQPSPAPRATPAPTEDTTGSQPWICPVCGAENTGNFCENDAQPSPAPTVTAEPAAESSTAEENALVGSYITFGSYPQGADGEVEPIEWLVLDVQGGKALLISRYGLDTKPYHSAEEDVTWETCELRSWLNNDFINAAFTPEEQAAIVTTTCSNPDVDWAAIAALDGCQWDSSWPDEVIDCPDTQDKLFLLSCDEAYQYFATNEARMAAPTEYAIANNATQRTDYRVDGRNAGWWWLRSSGGRRNSAGMVIEDGTRRRGIENYDYVTVRPALWMDLESGAYATPESVPAPAMSEQTAEREITKLNSWRFREHTSYSIDIEKLMDMLKDGKGRIVVAVWEDDAEDSKPTVSDGANTGNIDLSMLPSGWLADSLSEAVYAVLIYPVYWETGKYELGSFSFTARDCVTAVQVVYAKPGMNGRYFASADLVDPPPENVTYTTDKLGFVKLTCSPDGAYKPEEALEMLADYMNGWSE